MSLEEHPNLHIIVEYVGLLPYIQSLCSVSKSFYQFMNKNENTMIIQRMISSEINQHFLNKFNQNNAYESFYRKFKQLFTSAVSDDYWNTKCDAPWCLHLLDVFAKHFPLNPEIVIFVFKKQQIEIKKYEKWKKNSDMQKTNQQQNEDNVDEYDEYYSSNESELYCYDSDGNNYALLNMIEYFQDMFKDKLYDDYEGKNKFDFSTSESIEYFANELRSFRYVTEWCIERNINKINAFVYNPSQIKHKILIPIWLTEYIIPLIASLEGVFYACIFFRQLYCMFCYDYVGDNVSYNLSETKKRFHYVFNKIKHEETIKQLSQVSSFKQNLVKGLCTVFRDRNIMRFETYKEQTRWMLQQLNNTFDSDLSVL
eukprot:515453_1